MRHSASCKVDMQTVSLLRIISKVEDGMKGGASWDFHSFAHSIHAPTGSLNLAMISYEEERNQKKIETTSCQRREPRQVAEPRVASTAGI